MTDSDHPSPPIPLAYRDVETAADDVRRRALRRTAIMEAIILALLLLPLWGIFALVLLAGKKPPIDVAILSGAIASFATGLFIWRIRTLRRPPTRSPADSPEARPSGRG